MLRLKDIKEQLNVIQRDIDMIERHTNTLTNKSEAITYNPYEEYYKKAVEAIEMQNKTIENLVNILCGKYEHGLFVMTNDCGNPTVIKDGKIITSNKVSSFSVDWSHGETITLSYDEIDLNSCKMI